MGLGRALLCILLPPLAVLDRGCGTVLIVLALTIAGWVPGALAALSSIMSPPTRNVNRYRLNARSLPCSLATSIEGRGSGRCFSSFFVTFRSN